MESRRSVCEDVVGGAAQREPLVTTALGELEQEIEALGQELDKLLMRCERVCHRATQAEKQEVLPPMDVPLVAEIQAQVDRVATMRLAVIGVNKSIEI